MLDSKFLGFLVLVGMSAAWAAPEIADYLVRGKVGGISTHDNDDRIDGAIVIKTLSPQALMSFQIGDFLAPDEDMKAGPTTQQVPGNLYFPRQKERYGIFPVTLKKENFSIPYVNRTEEELFSLAFSIPMDEALDKAKGPYVDLLRLIRFRNFGLSDLRDWSQESKIVQTVNRPRKISAQYTWSRTRAARNEWDSVISFQKTPANRYAFADFRIDPKDTGNLDGISGLVHDFAYFFMRVKDSEDGRNPKSFSAHFVRDRGGEVVVNGLPNFLSGTRIENRRKVNWDPITNSFGAIAVLRGSRANKDTQYTGDRIWAIFSDMGLGRLLQFAHPLVDWVDPALGVYTLATPLESTDSLTLVHLKTDVPLVSAEGRYDFEDGDTLLDHLTEMRAEILQ